MSGGFSAPISAELASACVTSLAVFSNGYREVLTRRHSIFFLGVAAGPAFYTAVMPACLANPSPSSCITGSRGLTPAAGFFGMMSAWNRCRGDPLHRRSPLPPGATGHSGGALQDAAFPAVGVGAAKRNTCRKGGHPAALFVP